MNILEKIFQHKEKEVQEKKELYPTKLLEKSIYFDSPCLSLRSYIKDNNRSGIIAEFKRKSPSKGFINKYASPESVTLGYMQSGASALSVLTDETFFGAQKNDLEKARKFNFCPILQKDFILDEYQIIEAKSRGADAILLIASMLSKTKIDSLTSFAHSLGLEVLLETHNEKEVLDHADTKADLIGINNRNLQTFEVDTDNSIRLLEKLPVNLTKVAESGIDSIDTLLKLKNNGFDGFLIGEYFMKNSHPPRKCRELVKSILHES